MPANKKARQQILAAPTSSERAGPDSGLPRFVNFHRLKHPSLLSQQGRSQQGRLRPYVVVSPGNNQVQDGPGTLELRQKRSDN
ncbi:hypothetical protein HDF08_002681 [Edaphobacter lichenicola]|uniref:Uncharacterized protein n=1 Tax=Tunturiibacter lichenicola TaxID=2051959 RepID=A0A852VHN5_9BACT|nr:hypothetical protein [Edaphobacter lichenicola]